jgi:hypothetical protein
MRRMFWPGIFAGVCVSLASLCFASDTISIEAARMRNGLFQGRAAREFTGGVVLRERTYTVRADSLVFFHEKTWEASGAVGFTFPGVRIDAESGGAQKDTLALRQGSAYFFAIIAKIDFAFVRCVFAAGKNACRFDFEDARLSLPEWEEERLFPAAAVIMDEDGLAIEFSSAAGDEKIIFDIARIDDLLTEYIEKMLARKSDTGDRK